MFYWGRLIKIWVILNGDPVHLQWYWLMFETELIKWTGNRLSVQKWLDLNTFNQVTLNQKMFSLRGHFVLVEQQVEIWSTSLILSIRQLFFLHFHPSSSPLGSTRSNSSGPVYRSRPPPPVDDLKVPPYLRLNRIPLFGRHNRRTVWWWLCSGSGIPPLMRNLSFTDPPHLPPGLLLPTPNRNDPTGLSTTVEVWHNGTMLRLMDIVLEINTEAYWSNSLTHLFFQDVFFNEETFSTNLKWIWSTYYQYYQYIRNNNFAAKKIEFNC